jgi:hypothetical protein
MRPPPRRGLGQRSLQQILGRVVIGGQHKARRSNSAELPARNSATAGAAGHWPAIALMRHAAVLSQLRRERGRCPAGRDDLLRQRVREMASYRHYPRPGRRFRRPLPALEVGFDEFSPLQTSELS